MQRLADILGAPVDRPQVLETTALGRGMACGNARGPVSGAGRILRETWALDRAFEPGGRGPREHNTPAGATRCGGFAVPDCCRASAAIRLRPPCGPANPVYCGIDTIDLAQATKLIQSIAGGRNRPSAASSSDWNSSWRTARRACAMPFRRRCGPPGVGFFLDLKLHDIPNTVAGGIRAVVETAPTFITIHASGGRGDAEGGGGRSRHAGGQVRRRAAEALGRHGPHLARPLRPRGHRRHADPVRSGAAPGGLARGQRPRRAHLLAARDRRRCASSAARTSC